MTQGLSSSTNPQPAWTPRNVRGSIVCSPSWPPSARSSCRPYIVEDVAVLCPRFAVISKGRLKAETTPHEARERLQGKIFEGRGSNEELQAIRDQHLVTQAILVEGRNRVRIYVANGPPPAGFEPVTVTLEDAYMTLVNAPEGAVENAVPPVSQSSELPAESESRA